jgi:ribonuclease R
MTREKGSKKGRRGDPHAEREARRYEHPIPSREYILDYLESVGEPVDFGVLAEGVGVGDARGLAALRNRVGAMLRDGQPWDPKVALTT